MTNPRQIAFNILREIERKNAYTDIALDRGLKQAKLDSRDRGLVTELVYGIVRRQRSLLSLIDQLGKKKAQQQPPDLRIILQIGLYQLRYLNQIPVSAAVNTTVELAKENKLGKLAGVVNGILRQYIRLQATAIDPLNLPQDPVNRLGVLYSFPNWIIELWLEMLGATETEQLCQWFNQPPAVDIRINTLQTNLETVESALMNVGVKVSPIPHLPYALRLTGNVGAIQQLPGFAAGWWTVQDSSAQLVSYLLDPQPGQVIIDVCAAPGGKSTHIAELIQDQGIIWACDRVPSRLRKVEKNARRLQLNSLKICAGDSRELSQFQGIGDRVLLDAPCSGLGTLHKRPDIRWRQTPAKIEALTILQKQLLKEAATWVKPKGILVYATCTLNPVENESMIATFLEDHPHWQIQPPSHDSPVSALVTDSGWIKILPHRQHMDGFFMVRLSNQE
jgi:16S rRNA (cytosine967-C5)-methyltransferase